MDALLRSAACSELLKSESNAVASNALLNLLLLNAFRAAFKAMYREVFTSKRIPWVGNRGQGGVQAICDEALRAPESPKLWKRKQKHSHEASE